MSKKTRYTSEEQIIRLIDTNQSQALRLLKKADHADSLAESHSKLASELDVLATLKTGDDLIQAQIESKTHRAAAFKFRDDARKKRRRATTKLEDRAKKLQNILAAFRTEPMAVFLGDDRTVVA